MISVEGLPRAQLPLLSLGPVWVAGAQKNKAWDLEGSTVPGLRPTSGQVAAISCGILQVVPGNPGQCVSPWQAGEG